MPVRIETIKVPHLGPLDKFEMELGAVNLVYAHNEQGKTHLVEFLIQSLFKKPPFTEMRKLTDCRGEVCVSGIGSKAHAFSLQGSGKKLDETLKANNISLPPSISRLLVVRAGELSLLNNGEGGVNRTILKEFLSNEGFIDRIEKGISKTVQAVRIEAGGTLMGPNAGEMKVRTEKQRLLRVIDDLLSRVDEEYSGGSLALLNAQQKESQAELDRLEQARRHRAWKLSQEIERIHGEQANLPREKIEELKHEIWKFTEKSQRTQEKTAQQKEKQARCEHYNWLVEAVVIYKGVTGPALELPKQSLLYGFSASLAVGVIASFLGSPLLTLIFILFAIGIGWVYLRNTLALIERAADLKEREAIGAEFTRRFGIPFSGLALMEEQRKKLEPEKAAADYMLSELENDQRALDALGSSIRQKLAQLTAGSVPQDQWDAVVASMFNRIHQLESELNQLLRQQDAIHVSAEDYLASNPGTAYDHACYERCCAEIANRKQEISSTIDSKASLKQAIAMQTGLQGPCDWEVLLEALKTMRKILAEEYRRLTAQVAAGNLVFKALEGLRLEEGLHIEAGLQSELVREPLKRLTGRYETLSLEGDKLKVNDGLGGFFLSDLSTGAQEQILLALRIGFAQKWMEQTPLFLILDDAFQHSDWKRRIRLVDEMVCLAQQDWQILYFTMDDHIRDLFEQRVKPIFGEQYRFLDLSPNYT